MSAVTDFENSQEYKSLMKQCYEATPYTYEVDETFELVKNYLKEENLRFNFFNFPQYIRRHNFIKFIGPRGHECLNENQISAKSLEQIKWGLVCLKVQIKEIKTFGMFELFGKMLRQIEILRPDGSLPLAGLAAGFVCLVVGAPVGLAIGIHARVQQKKEAREEIKELALEGYQELMTKLQFLKSKFGSYEKILGEKLGKAALAAKAAEFEKQAQDSKNEVNAIKKSCEAFQKIEAQHSETCSNIDTVTKREKEVIDAMDNTFFELIKEVKEKSKKGQKPKQAVKNVIERMETEFEILQKKYVDVFKSHRKFWLERLENLNTNMEHLRALIEKASQGDKEAINNLCTTDFVSMFAPPSDLPDSHLPTLSEAMVEVHHIVQIGENKLEGFVLTSVEQAKKLMPKPKTK